MLLRSTDRIIAFAIMYQCYPSEKPSVNPFVFDMMNVSSFHRESVYYVIYTPFRRNDFFLLICLGLSYI